MEGNDQRPLLYVSTHATDDPFEATFDQYTLTAPKK